MNNLEHKEGEAFNQNSKKEKEFKKKQGEYKEPLGQHQMYQHLNHRGDRGVEGEEKEQEIENLFENTMKENFPNLVKEIDIQVQEAQRVQKKMDLKRNTPRHIIIKMLRLKIKRES